MDNKKVKTQFILSLLSVVMIVITIIVLVYEDLKKLPRTTSYYFVAASLLVMGISQLYNFKTLKTPRSLIFGVLYIIIGAAIIISSL